MKTPLTLLAFSGLSFITGLYIEYTNQTTTGYSDNGWTRSYTIPKGKRRLSQLFLYIAGVLLIGSILGFIWLTD